MYANKLVTTRHAIESKNTPCNHVMELEGIRLITLLIPIRIFFLQSSWWRGFKALLSQRVPFS
eukprot:1161262-Pelagomonas_calceolata.AAC.7